MLKRPFLGIQGPNQWLKRYLQGVRMSLNIWPQGQKLNHFVETTVDWTEDILFSIPLEDFFYLILFAWECGKLQTKKHFYHIIS